MKSNRKHILISAPFGYSIKNLLYSSFWESEYVRQAKKVTVLTPVPDIYEKYLKKQNAKNIEVKKFNTNITFGMLFGVFWQIKKNKFLDQTHSATQAIRWMELRQKNLLLFAIKKLLIFFSRLLADKLIDQVLIFLTPSINFQVGKVDVWLSLAPSFEIEEVVSKYVDKYQKDSTRIAFIHSWDNLSSKGPLIRRYDKILVWGSSMKKEAVSKLKYDDQDVIEVGMPQYDSFYLLRKKGRQPKKQILYTSGHPNSIPREIEYVEDTLAVMKEAFPEFKLIIRVHPNDSVKRYENLIKTYKNIIVEDPGERTEQTCDKWMPGYSDIQHFADLLQESSVVINIASTISIDASYFHIPVICMCYDQPKAKAGNKVSQFYGFEHFKELISTKGVYLCKRKEKIQDLIALAISKVNTNQEKLTALYDSFQDGKAGKRIGDALEIK